MSLGGATSGTLSGFIQPMIPALPVPGLLETGIGVVGQYFVKKGLINAYFKGVMVAGIANIIASFIPQIAGTFPSGKHATTYQGAKSSQVDGALHSTWAAEQELYIHRNPIGGPVVETSQVPAGTQHLKQKLPSIRWTH